MVRYASKIELKYGMLLRYGSRCEVRSTQILNVPYRTAILARYAETRKAATLAVTKSKEKLWEEFGCRLDFNYFSANKVFCQTIRHLRGKRSSVTYSIMDSAGNILMESYHDGGNTLKIF